MTQNETKQKTTIDYEVVTIKIPKKIMPYLRSNAAKYEYSLEEEIERDLLDNVRAEMEASEGEEAVKSLGVGEIFYELLGDQHYKPEN